MYSAAFIAFVFVGLFSPGPNIILLTASGARFGFRRTLPHILGVAAGVGITSAVTGLGVGALLQTHPALTLVLKIIACLWILQMAYVLWFAAPPKSETNDKPWTFFQAVLFQWVNPKVWAVALAAMAYVVDLEPLQQAFAMGTVFMSINICVCLFWTSTGTLLTFLLTDETAWRVFMRVMALLLAVSSATVFL